MMAQDANRVIVAGCGPVGAVMALALVKKGIAVTLIEQLPDAAEDQRAATIHPPTVEMLAGLGLKTEMFSELPSGGNVLCALPGASTCSRDLQQGSRSTYRRLRPCQQPDWWHGHERWHPRRHQSCGKTCGDLGWPRRHESTGSLH